MIKIRRREFSLDAIPDDFDEWIANEFAEYTRDTAEQYTFHDKLCFIDNIVASLHQAYGADDAVMELMKNRFEYEVSENGNFPDESDFLCIEFLSECYEHGVANAQLVGFGKDIHEREKIEKLLIRIMLVVLNWEAEK